MNDDGQTGRTDRTPPNNVAAEKVALGAMMLSTEAAADVLDILKPGDYYVPKHGTIHSAILHLYSRGEPTSAIAVMSRLMAIGEIARTGGAPYLHECIAEVPTVANAGWHARQVHTAAGRRRLIEAANLTLRAAYDPTLDLPQAIDQAGQAILQATGEHDKSELLPAAEIAESALQVLIEASEKGDGLPGIPTGFSDLDRLTGGFRPGQLIVVAGRPGMGKSVLSTDFARNSAYRGGKTVAIFNMEMTKEELTHRIWSAESRIPLHHMTSGSMTEREWGEKLPRAISDYAGSGLYIDDSPGLTVTDIRSRARRIAQRGPLDMIVVDYLQLMTPAGGRKNDNRQQEVADMSRGLKLLAKELQVPVIAVAQLNRGVEMRQDKRPHLADLRESGALEQDADIVLFVHRDDYYDKASPRGGEADLVVAKHRGGPTDTITVAAQLHLSRFVDMAIV